MRFPKDDDVKDVIQEFKEHWVFPYCGGTIDCTRIPIKAQQHAHGDYLSKKGFYSLILQGV